MNTENIDIEALRQDIIDYYGTAAYGFYPAAYTDVASIENATDEEVVKKAMELHFDLNKYKMGRFY